MDLKTTEFNKFVSWESLLIVELDKIEKNLISNGPKNVAVKTEKKYAPEVSKNIKRKGDNPLKIVEKKRKIDTRKVTKVSAKRKGVTAGVTDAKKKKIETNKVVSKKSVNCKTTKANK